MLSIKTWFVFVALIGFGNVTAQNLQNENIAILCRGCGHGVAHPNEIFSKPSPKSYYYFNDTLFDTDGVLVEVFKSDFFFQYFVIAFHESSCVAIGEWDESTSWYPGYRWKPCVCPECGAYIGWVFEPINPDLVEPSKTFYGLILNTLISETSIMAADTLSTEDQEFLARCEEELKDRYTEKDDDFMNVYNQEQSIPPVVDSWWSSNNQGRRNDRRGNRRPYERYGRDNRDRDRGYHDRRDNRDHRDRGYNDYSRGYDDRGQGYRPQRHRY